MAIIRIAWQCRSMQRELAPLGAIKRCDHGDLDAKLIRHVGLALANALDLWGMQAVDLAGFVAGFLGHHPCGKIERMLEGGLKGRVAFDLPPNVPDGAAQIGGKFALHLASSFELLGMGVTLMLDQGELADTGIGLPELKAVGLGQPHQLFAGPVHQLAIGGNITAFG